MSQRDGDRVCEECGRWIEAAEILYRVRLEVFAEPTVNLPDTPPDKDENSRDWNALIQRMEEMTDEQVREAEDQVHERIDYNLCRDCRRSLHSRIRRRRDMAGG